MAYFKTMTTETVDKGKKNAVIMGRKTWESIPAKYRPLEGRLNIILSKSMKILCSQRTKGCAILCDSLQEGLSKLADNSRSIESVWVIGGSSLYEECIVSPLCHRVYLTEIKKKFECDVFFPDIPENFHLVKWVPNLFIQFHIHLSIEIKFI
ncbi:hypothetical protein AAG570_000653 [Ranatra chinensis]|uniref:dihydrofolate reductase n=1 Tax=Ranatra chinensis TaxID=642074 RepID=A0ABD0ZIW5_9HEMI